MSITLLWFHCQLRPGPIFEWPFLQCGPSCRLGLFERESCAAKRNISCAFDRCRNDKDRFDLFSEPRERQGFSVGNNSYRCKPIRFYRPDCYLLIGFRQSSDFIPAYECGSKV